MAVAAIGFAIMNACAKEASRRVPFLEVAFARAAIGAVCVIAWARLRGLSLRVSNRRVMAMRVVSGTISMILTFYALSVAPLGEASALLNLTPLFVAAIAVIWLRERVEALVAVCLLVGLCGALLVFRPHHGFAIGRGGVAALVAAGTAALAMTSIRRLGSSESSEAIVAWFQTFGAVVIGTLAIPGMMLPGAGDLALLVVSGVSATIAQLAMTRAYAADAAARVGGMNYLNIVASVSLGVVVFGERPDPVALAGIAAIVASGAGLVWSARRQSSAPS
jgi:drug/metabolite transporter (DMT)-like permease